MKSYTSLERDLRLHAEHSGNDCGATGPANAATAWHGPVCRAGAPG
ncbi:hypothetical protein [Arthrobacter sp. DR-2P]